MNADPMRYIIYRISFARYATSSSHLLVLMKFLKNWDAMKKLYGGLDEIDLYVGLLYEPYVDGKEVFGPTFKCINTDQFIALKKGDKFFYTKENVFKKAQVDEIKRTGLAKVICTMMKKRNNEDESVVHENAKTKKEPFKKFSEIIDCEDLGDYDFSAWKEGKY